MRRFEAHDTWGVVAVRDLAPITVQTARDAMKETAVMANQMLSVGRIIWDWAIPLDLAKFNPFDKVRDFDTPDRGHVPWPSWVIDYVRTHAWPDLVRMMRLGVMTCQRGSDLIRMGRSTAIAMGAGVARSRPESAAGPFTFPLRPPTRSRSTGGPRRRKGKQLCHRWKEWVAAQVKKYEWDIEPDDADHPTIHGLRGTGILARAEQAYEVD
jgi:hypothetical protein